MLAQETSRCDQHAFDHISGDVSGSDGEVCSFAVSALPGATSTKKTDVSTDVFQDEDMRKNAAPEEPSAQPPASQRSHVDLEIMLSPLPLPRRSLSELEVISRAYTRVIGSIVHRDAVRDAQRLAANNEPCAELKSMFQRLQAHIDAAAHKHLAYTSTI